jgi:hypothetical protein
MFGLKRLDDVTKQLQKYFSLNFNCVEREQTWTADYDMPVSTNKLIWQQLEASGFQVPREMTSSVSENGD